MENVSDYPLWVVFVRHDVPWPIASLPSTAEGPAGCVEACGLAHATSPWGRLIGVYAGLIDTEMGAALSPGPKTSQQQVAGKTIEGIVGGLDHVLADERAEELWRATRDDLVKPQSGMQTGWDRRST